MACYWHAGSRSSFHISPAHNLVTLWPYEPTSERFAHLDIVLCARFKWFLISPNLVNLSVTSSSVASLRTSATIIIQSPMQRQSECSASVSKIARLQGISSDPHPHLSPFQLVIYPMSLCLAECGFKPQTQGTSTALLVVLSLHVFDSAARHRIWLHTQDDTILQEIFTCKESTAIKNRKTRGKQG